MEQNTTERDPKLDACDKEITEILTKYGKVIRPLPFIDSEGRILAQVVYFDAPAPAAPAEGIPEIVSDAGVEKESMLEKPE